MTIYNFSQNYTKISKICIEFPIVNFQISKISEKISQKVFSMFKKVPKHFDFLKAISVCKKMYLKTSAGYFGCENKYDKSTFTCGVNSLAWYFPTF